MRSRIRPFYLVLAALIFGCTPTVTKEEMARAVEGYIVDVQKLSVVDCLLPGQMRKLGSSMTYVSGKRPLRTTEADCEVRGGEYVAYDRADYASALNVWLEKAKEGDAVAQLYVGQIYEKGLGRTADYREAAVWYRRSAEQNNAQAQVNLGQLYEKGLGVPKETQTAIEYYSKATGLEKVGVNYLANVASKTPKSLPPPTSKAPVYQLTSRDQASPGAKDNLELIQLKSALDIAQQQVIDQQQQLIKTQADLAILSSQQHAVPPNEDATKVRALETEVQRKDEALAAKERELVQQKAVRIQKPTVQSDDHRVQELEAKLLEREQQLKSQVARLNKMSQMVKVEREKSSRMAPQPLAKASGSADAQQTKLLAARQEVSQLETLLASKLASFNNDAAEMTAWLTSTAAASDPALRQRIDLRKTLLQQQSVDIREIKAKLSNATTQVQGFESKAGSLQLAANGPRIDILEPQTILTRGTQALKIDDSHQLKGRVMPANIKSLLFNGMPLKTDAEGVFVVPLDPEKMPDIVIKAEDQKGVQAEVRFALLKGGGPEAIGASVQEAPLVPNLSSEGIDLGHFFALIIGNNDYARYPHLTTPINDVKSVDVILRERYGFTTRVIQNGNRHDIMTAFNELQARMAEKDSFLIYYAGHGEIDNKTREAYWLPVDAEVGNTANWIPSKAITDLMSIMPARHIIVVSDSCYSGAMSGAAVAKLPSELDAEKKEKWLKVMATKKGRTVLTSGDVKPVLDNGGDGHSVFAHSFLKLLRSNQGLLEDYEIYRVVSVEVAEAAARLGFNQTPSYAPLQYAGHEGSPFIFKPRL
ncbi:MAG: caspase family protein [Methylococcaceae bacterium]